MLTLQLALTMLLAITHNDLEKGHMTATALKTSVALTCAVGFGFFTGCHRTWLEFGSRGVTPMAAAAGGYICARSLGQRLTPIDRTLVTAAVGLTSYACAVGIKYALANTLPVLQQSHTLSEYTSTISQCAPSAILYTAVGVLAHIG